MNLVLNNPYRIAGLLAGASAREQTSQIKKLKMLIEVGEPTPLNDFSFPVLGKIDRSIGSILTAESNLNLNENKMEAALFWFWKGNPITDEVAFENLKNNKIDDAYKIWHDLIDATEEDGCRTYKPVTKKNFSAFHNCCVIEIIKGNKNLINAVNGNLYFLECPWIGEFILSVADKTYRATSAELQIMFLTQLFENITVKKEQEQLLEIVLTVEFSAKQIFLKNLAQKLITEISAEIGLAKQRDRTKPILCYQSGENLMKKTKTLIQRLSKITDKNDLISQSISDKLAQEILQCGIDYYNETDEKDCIEKAMVLQKYALSIAIGSCAKARCQENYEILEKNRIRNETFGVNLPEVIFIGEELENFENKSATIENAKSLIDNCKPKLSVIKNNVGPSEEVYLKLSTAVANRALGMLVDVVNREQENPFVRLGDFAKLKSAIHSALQVSKEIETMDMFNEQRKHFDNNYATLKSLAKQLNISRLPSLPSWQYTPSSSSSNSSSKESWAKKNPGCISALIINGIILGIILLIQLLSNS